MLLKIRLLAPAPAISKRRPFLTGLAKRRKSEGGIMPTKKHGIIIETPGEARQAEPGPSVLALLAVSTALAALILGGLWYVFFQG
jgi:hypothetical protein